MKKGWIALLVSFVCLMISPTWGGMVCAEEFPKRPIQIVVPWDAGGETDIVTRMVASSMHKYLGQPTVVINKPGAGGILGHEFFLKAPADGYTLVSTGPTLMIISRLQKTSYSVSDFFPLVQMCKTRALVLVPKDSPWRNLNDFFTDAKKNPGGVQFGVPGVGSWHRLMWEVLIDQTEINIAMVPFTGNASVITALLGGHIKVALLEPLSVLSHIRSGALKPLAISEKDDQNFPGVLTFAEQGIKGDFSLWRGILGHKNLPPERVQILEKAFTKVLDDHEYRQGLKKLESTPGNLVGENFRKFLNDDDKVYAKMVTIILKKK